MLFESQIEAWRKLSLTKKIVRIAAAVIVVGGIGYLSYQVATYDTTRFLELPEADLQLVTADGETITLRAKVADTSASRSAHFRRVNARVARESILLLSYVREARNRKSLENVRIPLDMAFFDTEGTLVETTTTTLEQTSYRSELPYRYAVIGKQGMIADLGIDGDTRLIPESTARVRVASQ